MRADSGAGGALPGYLAAPAGASPRPGMVVLYDAGEHEPPPAQPGLLVAGAGYLIVAPTSSVAIGDRSRMFRMMRETWRRQGP